MPRKSEYPISDIFINRWSSRAMSGEPIKIDELMPLFEAARWAPSAYNEQPWRFVYAHKNTQLWQEFLATLIPVNQSWAKNAAVLVVVLSKNFFDRTNGQSHTHSFDAGAAWMSLALQASLNGLVVHAMGGLDYDKVRETLQVPPEFTVEIIIAIGKPGSKEHLLPELQTRETPNDRKPLRELVFENKF
jgi:nitroreductase